MLRPITPVPMNAIESGEDIGVKIRKMECDAKRAVMQELRRQRRDTFFLRLTIRHGALAIESRVNVFFSRVQ